MRHHAPPSSPAPRGNRLSHLSGGLSRRTALVTSSLAFAVAAGSAVVVPQVSTSAAPSEPPGVQTIAARTLDAAASRPLAAPVASPVAADPQCALPKSLMALLGGPARVLAETLNCRTYEDSAGTGSTTPEPAPAPAPKPAPAPSATPKPAPAPALAAAPKPAPAPSGTPKPAPPAGPPDPPPRAGPGRPEARPRTGRCDDRVGLVGDGLWRRELRAGVPPRRQSAQAGDRPLLPPRRAVLANGEDRKQPSGHLLRAAPAGGRQGDPRRAAPRVLRRHPASDLLDLQARARGRHGARCVHLGPVQGRVAAHRQDRRRVREAAPRDPDPDGLDRQAAVGSQLCRLLPRSRRHRRPRLGLLRLVTKRQPGQRLRGGPEPVVAGRQAVGRRRDRCRIQVLHQPGRPAGEAHGDVALARELEPAPGIRHLLRQRPGCAQHQVRVEHLPGSRRRSSVAGWAVGLGHHVRQEPPRPPCRAGRLLSHRPPAPRTAARPHRARPLDGGVATEAPTPSHRRRPHCPYAFPASPASPIGPAEVTEQAGATTYRAR